jgi:hypothetical protein
MADSSNAFGSWSFISTEEKWVFKRVSFKSGFWEEVGFLYWSEGILKIGCLYSEEVGLGWEDSDFWIGGCGGACIGMGLDEGVGGGEWETGFL